MKRAISLTLACVLATCMTATACGPTATPEVLTHTPTPIPPTATSVPPSSTPTNTPIPPTNTPTPTPTSTPTPTLTNTPTATPTHIPTPTPTNTATPTPTPVPSLSGRVTDTATGQGVGGARVEAQLAGQYRWDYTASTASDGSYALFGLPTGDYKVRVTALGYAREYYDNVNPSSEATLVHVAVAKGASGIDFDLTEGGGISGHVYQSDGVTPVGDAQITVWPSKYPQEDGFHATTTADGSYVITGLALGSYTVKAEAPGYARKYYDEAHCWEDALDVKVVPPDDTPDIDIRLDHPGSISGYVFESDGSMPISKAFVLAELSLPRSCLGFGTCSNADGSYTIVNLPPHDYIVGVYKPGFGLEFYDAKNSMPAADVIPVTAGSDTPGINSTMDVGGAVTGHVYDENRIPIGEAGIGTQLLDGKHLGIWAHTQLDGSYRLWLKTGDYLIRAKVPGYVTEFYNGRFDKSRADPVQVTAPNETAGIDFYLARAGSISGHVYKEDGTTPIAGASVYAFPTTGDHPGAGANTQPDGSYTIQGLPSGNYRVQVTASGLVSQPIEVTVNAPNDTPGIDFALSPVSG